MKKYDLVVLFAGTVKAEDQERVFEKIDKDIKDAKGKVLETKDLGKRELAYLINKVSSAHYWHLIIELNADQVSAIRRKLALNDNILRFLLVNFG